MGLLTSSETTTTATEAGTTTATEPFCAQSTVLANPTPFSNFNTEFGADDDYDSVTLPFPVGIFGSSSSTVCTNGFLSLDSGSAAYDNGHLPTKNVSPVSIMPYWADLYAPSNAVCGTGIAYEVHETSKGQTFTVEYYIGIYGTSPSNEHFTLSLYKGVSQVCLLQDIWAWWYRDCRSTERRTLLSVLLLVPWLHP